MDAKLRRIRERAMAGLAGAGVRNSSETPGLGRRSRYGLSVRGNELMAFRQLQGAAVPQGGPSRSRPVEAEIADIRRLIAEGDLAAAEQAVEAALAEHQDGHLHHLQGYLHQQAGRPELTARAIELGLEDWSNDLILGASLMTLGRYEEAREPLARAYERSPQNAEAAAALLEAIATLDGIQTAGKLFESMVQGHGGQTVLEAWSKAASARIRRLLDARELGEAAYVCREALRTREDGYLYLLQGYIQQEFGRFDLAAEACARAVEFGLDDWSNYVILGSSLRSLGRYEEARVALLKALERSPGSADAASALLEVTAALEGIEAAQRLFESMAEHADNASFRQTWAVAMSAHVRKLMESGERDEAEVLCRETLRGAEHGPLHHVLGHIEHQTGRFELAVQSCQRAIELGVQDWSNHLILGLSLKILDRRDEARLALAAAHRLSPTRLDAALLFLEETLATEGLDSAEALFASLQQHVNEPGPLKRAWRQLVDAFSPPSIDLLLQQGKIEEAEAECRSFLDTFNSRRIRQTLDNIKTYKEWLQFTSEQRSRNDPDRRPSISIFLITYNHEKYIAQALDGILMQETDCHYEINVIDDCSTDGTQAVVLTYKEKYPDLIHTYFNPTNIGTLDPPQQKVTYNGYKTLKGDYIAILEGDDFWSDPKKLQKQISFLEGNPAFAACCHNTMKIYEGGGQEPHRFLYWAGTKPVHTIDDAAEMRMFFHTSSMMYRNVLKGIPPRSFASKWSCDIFFTMAHIQHGKLRYFDEDMSVYRAHAGGLYSNMSALKGRLFNIEGLLRYNQWLGFRYLKGFSFSLHRLCVSLLNDVRNETLPALSRYQRFRYETIALVAGGIYALLDRYPKLDPAVFWYKEPPKPSDPRKEKLAEYNLV